MSMSTYISSNTYVGKTLLEWWGGLDDDRAGRATLRRAASITAVTLTPAYQRLFRRLNVDDWREYQRDRLAAVVGLLSHVRADDDRTLPKAMSSTAEGSDRPCVSEMRFVRLLESQDIDALFTGLRRVLPLIKYNINVLELANDVVNWNDQVKKRWVYDFEWPQKARN
jgi:CRISPR system Cascade subunit CasB